MAKLELRDVADPTKVGVFNANFEDIKNYINDETLKRQVDVNQPNQMEADLDMNSNQILNVALPTTPGGLATKGYVDGAVASEASVRASEDQKEASRRAAEDQKLQGQISALQVEAADLVPSLASLEASPELFVGQLVQCLGFDEEGDGGDNFYEIVEDGPEGREEGYFPLPASGLRARGLFLDGVNVRQFGAKGDSVADDSPAFNEATAFLLKFEAEAHLYVPSGKYRFFSRWEHFGSYGEVFRFNVKGDGPENSQLIEDSSLSEGIFRLDLPGNAFTCHLDGLGFYATQVNQGDAVHITQPGTGDQVKRTVSISNCRAAPYPNSLSNPNGNGCFTRGFVVNGSYFPLFYNIFVASPWGPTSNGEIVEYGIDVTGSYSPKIVLSHLQNVNYGIYNPDFREGQETRAESMAVYSTIILCEAAGILFERTSTMFEPQLEVVGGHINYRQHGIRASYIHHLKIDGVLFYFHGAGDEVEPSDILFQDCNSGHIGGNVFTAGPNGTENRIGVDLLRSSQIEIDNNIFSGGMLLGIRTSPTGCNNNIVGPSNIFADSIPGTVFPAVQSQISDRAQNTQVSYSENTTDGPTVSYYSEAAGVRCPTHRYYKNSDSVVNGATIGRIRATAKNSSGEDHSYVTVSYTASDISDGSEQGAINFFTDNVRQATVADGVALGATVPQGQGSLNSTGLYINGEEVVSEGANANGSFVRYANGTQRCRIKRISLPYLGASNCSAQWNFPAPFIDSDFVCTTSITSPDDASSPLNAAADAGITVFEIGHVTQGSQTSSKVNLAVFKAPGATGSFAPGDTMYLDVVAEGRWK